MFGGAAARGTLVNRPAIWRTIAVDVALEAAVDHLHGRTVGFDCPDVTRAMPRRADLVADRAIEAGVDQRASGQRRVVGGALGWIQRQRAKPGVEPQADQAARQGATVVG